MTARLENGCIPPYGVACYVAPAARPRLSISRGPSPPGGFESSCCGNASGHNAVLLAR